MIDLLDPHTHTTASGHAYNFLYGMVHLASVRGLSLFECSDHAPTMLGSCHSFYFINFKVLPRTLRGVRLMVGVELNITDYNGTASLEQSILEPLDYVITSLHQPYIHSDTALQSTSVYLRVFENPLTHVIGHPDGSRFPIGYDIPVIAAGEHHKLLEINSNSLNLLSFRVGARDNYIKVLGLCRHYGINIIIDGDAHYEADVGDHGSTRALLEGVGFLQELMVNMFLDRLRDFLPRAAAILVQQEDERCGRLHRSRTIQEEIVQEGNASGGNES